MTEFYWYVIIINHLIHLWENQKNLNNIIEQHFLENSRGLFKCLKLIFSSDVCDHDETEDWNNITVVSNSNNIPNKLNNLYPKRLSDKLCWTKV